MTTTPAVAPLSATELDKLEALAKAATPGPWDTADAYADNGQAAGVNIYANDGTMLIDDGTIPGEADCAFIAAANPATILALIAQARAAQQAGAAAPSDAHAYDEACNLAKAIYSQHYREGIEEWRVLPDLRGVIGQISNMVAGMTRTDRVHRLTAPTATPQSQVATYTAGIDPVPVEWEYSVAGRRYTTTDFAKAERDSTCIPRPIRFSSTPAQEAAHADECLLCAKNGGHCWRHKAAAPAGDAEDARRLSALLRGLECGPLVARLEPAVLFRLGQMIATQAKKAPDAGKPTLDQLYSDLEVVETSTMPANKSEDE